MSCEIFNNPLALLKKQIEQARMHLIVKVPRLSHEEIDRHLSKKPLLSQIGPDLYELNSDSDDNIEWSTVKEISIAKEIPTISLLDSEDDDDVTLPSLEIISVVGAVTAIGAVKTVPSIDTTVSNSETAPADATIGVIESAESTSRTTPSNETTVENAERPAPACSIAESTIGVIKSTIELPPVPSKETTVTNSETASACSIADSAVEVIGSSIESTLNLASSKETTISHSETAPACSIVDSAIGVIKSTIESTSHTTPSNETPVNNTETSMPSCLVANSSTRTDSMNETRIINEETSAPGCSVADSSVSSSSSNKSTVNSEEERSQNIRKPEKYWPSPLENLVIMKTPLKSALCRKPTTLGTTTIGDAIGKTIASILPPAKSTSDTTVVNIPQEREFLRSLSIENSTVGDTIPEQSASDTIGNIQPEPEGHQNPSIHNSITVENAIDETVRSTASEESAPGTDRNISPEPEVHHRSPSVGNHPATVDDVIDEPVAPTPPPDNLSMPSLDPIEIPIPDVPKLRVKSEAKLGIAGYSLLIPTPTKNTAVAKTDHDQRPNAPIQNATMKTTVESVVSKIIDQDRENLRNIAMIASLLKDQHISAQNFQRRTNCIAKQMQQISNGQFHHIQMVESESVQRNFSEEVTNRAAKVEELMRKCLENVNRKSLLFQIHSNFHQIMTTQKANMKNTTIFNHFTTGFLMLLRNTPSMNDPRLIHEFTSIIDEIGTEVINVPASWHRKRLNNDKDATREPVKNSRTETPLAFATNTANSATAITHLGNSNTSYSAMGSSVSANSAVATSNLDNSTRTYSPAMRSSVEANPTTVISHGNSTRAYSASKRSSVAANPTPTTSVHRNLNAPHAAASRLSFGYPNQQSLDQPRLPVYNPNTRTTNMTPAMQPIGPNMNRMLDPSIVTIPKPNAQTTNVARTMLPTYPMNEMMHNLHQTAASNLPGSFGRISEPVPNISMYHDSNSPMRNPPPYPQHIHQRVVSETFVYPGAVPDRLSPAANRQSVSPGSPIHSLSQFVFANSPNHHQFPTNPPAVPSYNSTSTSPPCQWPNCRQAMFHASRMNADQAYMPMMNPIMNPNAAANARSGMQPNNVLYGDKPLSVQVVNSSLSPNAGPSPNLVTSPEMPISVPIVQSSSSPNIDQIYDFDRLQNMTKPFLKDSEFEEFMMSNCLNDHMEDNGGDFM